MKWSTACPDWRERIVDRRSLVPFDPLFPAEAEAALAIFRELHIVDAIGRPTIGQSSPPWAFDLPRALFGAYDPETGRRLIRFYFEFVAKKNAKSTRAAGLMITALVRNWRDSGEFYILAPTKEIADNSYLPARDMVNADDGLRDIFKVQDNLRTITHRGNGAFLKVVAADSEIVGGKKTIGALIEELWLFGKRSRAEGMMRELVGGLASRPEGFIVYLSTQSDDPPAGVFAQKLDEFRSIRDGKIHDPRSLPLLYEYPEQMIKSGAYKQREYFYIPNPNLGASVDEEFLVDEMAKADRAGKASLINFEAKHLNIQVGLAQRADGWAGAEVWQRGVEKSLTLDALLDRSEVVTIGIDGGGNDDLLGIGVMGREKRTKRWLGWAHAFISDLGIERRKANIEDYNRFEREGTLTKFNFVDHFAGMALAEIPEDFKPPLPDDIQYIVDLVQRIRDLGLLAQVGVDAAGIGAIVDALAEIEITQDAETLDAVRQGIGLMGAFKTLERKLGDRTFLHPGSELLNWCVGNARVVLTSTASRIAREEAGFGKIDPLVALFNASHLMSLNPEAQGSVYSASRGLVMIG